MTDKAVRRATELRHLYAALQATHALIGGAEDHRIKRIWVRHEAGIKDRIRELERAEELNT